MPQAGSFLLISGFVHAVGFFSLLFFQPFNQHIKPFLGILIVVFSFFWMTVAYLKKNQRNLPLIRKSHLFLVVLFSLFFRGLLLTTSPALSDDIYRYEWDGMVQEAGINPYQFAPSDPALAHLRGENYSFINHSSIKTIYPPLTQLIFRLGVKIAPGIKMQRFLFLLFDLATLFLIVWLLILKKRSVLWSLVYGWNPLVVLEFAGSGHLDSLMLCLVVGSLVLLEKKKKGLAHFFLGLSVLAKWVTFVWIPWILAQRKLKNLFLFCFVVAIGLIPLIQGSSGGLAPYLEHWVFNSSLYGIIKIGLNNPLMIRILLGLILIVWSFSWAQKNKNEPIQYVFGAFLILLLASPVVYPWYVVWLVPFLCFYPLWGVLAWTGLVNLSYWVLIGYVSEGIWELSPWIQVVEYLPVYGLLFFEGVRSKQNQLRYVKKKSEKPKPPPMFVSVIIPAVNEEKSIGKVIEEIPKNIVNEIIVVNNSSTDNTAKVAKEAGARVVNENTMGYGRTVLKGMAHVSKKCDTIVILDGDHSDYPEDLKDLLEPIKRNEADMVIGGRTKAALPGSLTPHQRFGNWLTCTLIKWLYAWSYTDMGPFRVIRKSTLDSFKMEDKNFGWNVEMQVKALQLGVSVVEVPVRYRPRIGKSKISGTIKGTFMAGTIILYSIYRYGWNKNQ